jgi:sulfonate transport system substrate-binding protein
MNSRSSLSGTSLAVGLVAWLATFGHPQADPTVKSTAAAPKTVDNARVAHIALSDVTAVAGRKGWLKEEFDKINAKADLVLVSARGGSGVETSLLDRGELHITQRMAYPALQHRANGLDAVVIWQGVDPPPRRAVTLVPVDSGVQRLEELKNRTLEIPIVGHCCSRPVLYKAPSHRCGDRSVRGQTLLCRGGLLRRHQRKAAALTCRRGP